jgi:ketosteroid isomerase-like protein
MGRARQRWDELMDAWKAGDFEAIQALYAEDAVYNEPYNPPHNGNLLIVAYLKDFLGSKSDLEIETKRLLEQDGDGRVAVEWSFSYTAAGRRWTNLPRASFVDVGEDDKITYHRDYT